MEISRKIRVFAVGIVLVGFVAVTALGQYSAKGSSRASRGSYMVVAEPTPVIESFCEEIPVIEGFCEESGFVDYYSILVDSILEPSENLVPATGMTFAEESGKSREQLIDEVVAQFTWEGKEEEKEAFRQELLESGVNSWVIVSDGFGNSEE